MEAIRKTVTVKNNQINITLPADFEATEVEVIILPATDDYQIPQWQIDEVRERTTQYIENPEVKLDIDDKLLAILEERSKEDKSTFITSDESIARLKNRRRV